MIRLQKYLALCGVASRRASEKMIQEGRVAVNGSVITEMGVQVDETRDTVTVDGEIVRPEEEKHYIARTYLALLDIFTGSAVFLRHIASVRNDRITMLDEVPT